MKMTKDEKQQYLSVQKKAEKFRLKYYIFDSLAIACFCFEEGDEHGMYFGLLDANFYTDELWEIV